MPDHPSSVETGSVVTLREITQESLRSILRLDVAEHQKQFVASNAVSIAQAHFEEKAWFRAIYTGETPVGFLMLYDDPEEPRYYLWRFMIDARYQGNGYGRQGMELLISHVRSRPNATELLLSHVQGKGSPMGFYQQLGFIHTGEVEQGEQVMKLIL